MKKTLLKILLLICLVIVITPSLRVYAAVKVDAARLNEIDLLLYALETESDKETILEALDRLGQIGIGENVKLSLSEMFLHENEDVRAKALESIQRIYQLEKLEFLLNIISGSDQARRVNAVYSLFYISPRLYNDDVRIYNTLINVLYDKDPYMVTVAAGIFGKKKEARALLALSEVLVTNIENDNFSDKVSRSIIKAFRLIGKPSVPFVTKLLKDTSMHKIQNELFETLNIIGEPVSAGLLPYYIDAKAGFKVGTIKLLTNLEKSEKLSNTFAEFLLNETDFNVYTELCRSLTVMPYTKKVYESILFRLTDNDRRIVVLSKALLRAYAKEFTDDFLNLIDIGDTITKQTMVYVLGSQVIDNEAVLSSFTDRLYTEKEKAIWRALLTYVSQTEDKKSVLILTDLLKNDEKYDTSELITAFNNMAKNSNMHDQLSLNLIPMLKNDSKEIRLGLIDILSKVGNKEVMDAFTELSKVDVDYEVRFAAQRAVMDNKWLIEN